MGRWRDQDTARAANGAPNRGAQPAPRGEPPPPAVSSRTRSSRLELHRLPEKNTVHHRLANSSSERPDHTEPSPDGLWLWLAPSGMQGPRLQGGRWFHAASAPRTAPSGGGCGHPPRPHSPATGPPPGCGSPPYRQPSPRSKSFPPGAPPPRRTLVPILNTGSQVWLSGGIYFKVNLNMEIKVGHDYACREHIPSLVPGDPAGLSLSAQPPEEGLTLTPTHTHRCPSFSRPHATRRGAVWTHAESQGRPRCTASPSRGAHGTLPTPAASHALASGRHSGPSKVSSRENRSLHLAVVIASPLVQTLDRPAAPGADVRSPVSRSSCAESPTGSPAPAGGGGELPIMATPSLASNTSATGTQDQVQAPRAYAAPSSPCVLNP